LIDPWSPRTVTRIGTLFRILDEFSMPAKNRVNLSNDRHFPKLTSPQSFPLDGQTASLIVAEQDTTAANLLAEDLTLYLKILDLLLLLPAHVLTEYDEHHVKGLEKKWHWRSPGSRLNFRRFSQHVNGTRRTWMKMRESGNAKSL
jgi:hypothetical protein